MTIFLEDLKNAKFSDCFPENQGVEMADLLCDFDSVSQIVEDLLNSQFGCLWLEDNVEEEGTPQDSDSTLYYKKYLELPSNGVMMEGFGEIFPSKNGTGSSLPAGTRNVVHPLAKSNNKGG